MNEEGPKVFYFVWQLRVYKQLFRNKANSEEKAVNLKKGIIDRTSFWDHRRVISGVLLSSKQETVPLFFPTNVCSIEDF